jgi:hypothetical protein
MIGLSLIGILTAPGIRSQSHPWCPPRPTFCRAKGEAEGIPGLLGHESMGYSKGARRWIVSLSLALVLGAASFFPLSAAWSAATPLERAASIAFPLYMDSEDGKRRACTGFYARPAAVNGETGEPLVGWVFTAGHCVVHGVIYRADGLAVYEEAHPAVGSSAAGYDFGLLMLRDPSGPYRSKHAYLPFLDRSLQVGEPLFVLGFGGGQLHNVVGTYVGTDTLGIRIKTLEAVRGGMSGSPVLTWDGKAAGILVATRCKGPYTPGLGCDDDAYDATATPTSRVLQALRVLEPRFFEPPLTIWPNPY